MDNYILLKDLPDTAKGTKLIWDEGANAFYYEKGAWVSPHQRNYLTAGQVTQTPEWFVKEKDYAELFCFQNPTYSRKEILDLLKTCFPNKRVTGQYEISAARELYAFEQELRKLGKQKAEYIIAEHKYTIEDLKNCFEQSRLTHPMVGFKHDTFEQFISSL